MFEPVLNKSHPVFFFICPSSTLARKSKGIKKNWGGEGFAPSPSYAYDVITLGCIPKIFTCRKVVM